MGFWGERNEKSGEEMRGRSQITAQQDYSLGNGSASASAGYGFGDGHASADSRAGLGGIEVRVCLLDQDHFFCFEKKRNHFFKCDVAPWIGPTRI